jgi:hypothetical protein
MIRAWGKRFVVRADEKLTAFLELESAIPQGENDEYENHRSEACLWGWKVYEAPGVSLFF